MTTPRPRAVIMGLGLFGGGAAAVRHLHRQGYDILVTDLRTADVLAKSIEKLAEFPVEYRLGEHRKEDFEAAALVIKNPAVRADNEYLAAARASGAVVTSEMCLFLKGCKGKVIGITGSNGKTTTAYMTAAMLEAWLKMQATTESALAAKDSCSPRVWLGGNLGHPLLEFVGDIQPHDLVVLEISSFQLMDLDAEGLCPPISAITNITPNHLDWHRDMAEYVRAKSAIFRHAPRDGCVVLNADDPITARLGDHAPCRVIRFSLEPRDRVAATVRGGHALLRTEWKEVELFAASDLRLPGRHNVANALAAACLAHEAGATNEAIASALRDYRGVEHRLEFVDEIRGVRYYNDSIATTPESTVAAITSFDAPIYLLLGGSDKGLAFDGLAHAIAARPNIRRIYLTGMVAPKIAEAIHAACRAKPDPQRGLTVEQVDVFDDVVERVFRTAAPGAVFLMSPACASFYEYMPGKKFRNFEHRGEHFKSLVAALKKR